jgi:hypothetical protein
MPSDFFANSYRQVKYRTERSFKPSYMHTEPAIPQAFIIQSRLPLHSANFTAEVEWVSAYL